ncbi:MAG: hypothetical protein AB7U43_07065 [Desulfobacter sp.]
MAKRINITVPDKLYEQLQGVKDKFKISKVCQEAIMQKIQTIETGTNGDLIEFLKAGKMEFETKYFYLGQEWAEKAIIKKEISYKELIDMVKLHKKAVDDQETPLRMQIIKEFDLAVPKYQSISNFFDDSYHEEDDFMFNEDAFVRGYLRKCFDILETVKDKI